MPDARQYAVLGPLLSGSETRAFLGCEVVKGRPRRDLPVVVVWLPDDVTSDPKRVARLQRETSFVTQLRHPNIIRVYGLECFEEGWARVVAFANGEPLKRVLIRAREESAELGATLAARMIVDICEGVHFAHEEGQSRYAGRPIVHGGVRPDTLIVTFKGRTMVTGYGASILAPTQHGVPTLDKFVYFAPEQIIGGKATASPASDVYAIGSILYELLAGHPPYAGASDVERAVLTGDPPLLEAEGLPGRLGNIAATAMAKRGADRFDSVELMRDAILTALADEDAHLPSHEDVAAFVTELIPASGPERLGRRELLESADDPDAVTVLSRPEEAPEGVDADLFEASRPGPVSTMDVPIRSPLPREPETVVEEPPAEAPAVIPTAMADDEPTETAAAVDPLGEAGLPAFPDANGVSTWDTQVSEAPPAAEQAVLDAAAAVATIGEGDAPTVAETTDVIKRPRVDRTPTHEDADTVHTPQQVVSPEGMPAAEPGTAGIFAETLAAAAEPSAAQVPQSSPQVPQSSPQVPQSSPQVPQSSPQAVPQAPVAQPVAVAPQAPVSPHGMPVAQPGTPGIPAMGRAPVSPQGMPVSPHGMPVAQPGTAGIPAMGQAPVSPQGMPVSPQGMPVAQPGTAGIPAMGQVSPQGMPVSPQGMPVAQPGTPGIPAMGQAPVSPYGMPVAQPGTPGIPAQPTGPGLAIPPAATGPQPGVPGSFVGRSAVPNNGVGGNLPHPPPAATPRAPIREDSSITAFSKRAGDGSRSLLYLVILAMVAVLVFIFAFPKEPPKGLDEAPERHKLPKELVRAALENADKKTDEPDEPDEPDELVVENGTPGVDGAPDKEPEARTGTLSLKSEPRVSVYVDNELLGRTPLTATLPVGRHKLRFTDGKTGINKYRRYRIRPGGEHRDRITFGTSTLIVNAPDGAKIHLNGKRVGIAPMDPRTIYEGDYLLRVNFQETSWSERFTAPPGRKIEYNVRLGN